MPNIQICKNTNTKDKKVAKVSNVTLDEIIKAGQNKFKIKTKTVFNNFGDRLNEYDFNNLTDNVKIVLNDNKNYFVLSTTNDFGLTPQEKKEVNTEEIDVNCLAINTYVEINSLKQLKNVTKMPGMKYVVGMPDLHPGQNAPIGVACCGTKIYPELIGTDIGCGMALYQTTILKNKAKISKWEKALNLENEYDSKFDFLNVDLKHNKKIGTIGGGNHFAELSEVNEIFDKSFGIDRDFLYLLVHSGSRSLGKSIYEKHKDMEISEYLKNHDKAIKWARLNRQIIIERFMRCLDHPNDGKTILDIVHNFVREKEINGEKLYLHRKGAAPSDSGPIIIPGSRGALSYLVEPIEGVEQIKSCFSLAHGAGRRWTRSRALSQKTHVNSETLKTTKLGNVVICENKDLLYEEAPDAYKDIENIIYDLIEHKLIRLIASFKPVITYKQKAIIY